MTRQERCDPLFQNTRWAEQFEGVGAGKAFCWGVVRVGAGGWVDAWYEKRNSIPGTKFNNEPCRSEYERVSIDSTYLYYKVPEIIEELKKHWEKHRPALRGFPLVAKSRK
jgi:hypothetical protein